MISGELGYVDKEGFQELREEIGDVERMLKALIKSQENKHFPRRIESWTPGTLSPN
jgi:acyl-CoA synthetase (AMP-forming)/AMP-acid ligase II